MVLGALNSMGRYCALTGKSRCAKILLTKAPRSSWRLPEECNGAQEGSWRLPEEAMQLKRDHDEPKRSPRGSKDVKVDAEDCLHIKKLVV